jgi:hypothetical protein
MKDDINYHCIIDDNSDHFINNGIDHITDNNIYCVSTTFSNICKM